jgi:hypothetical protein
VRETYGFGADVVVDALGDYDLTRMVDDEGNALYAFPHEGSGPVPMATVERALTHVVDCLDGCPTNTTCVQRDGQSVCE